MGGGGRYAKIVFIFKIFINIFVAPGRWPNADYASNSMALFIHRNL